MKLQEALRPSKTALRALIRSSLGLDLIQIHSLFTHCKKKKKSLHLDNQLGRSRRLSFDYVTFQNRKRDIVIVYVYDSVE